MSGYYWVNGYLWFCSWAGAQKCQHQYRKRPFHYALGKWHWFTFWASAITRGKPKALRIFQRHILEKGSWQVDLSWCKVGAKIFAAGLARSSGAPHLPHVGADPTTGTGASERGTFNPGTRIKSESAAINKLILCITRTKFYLCFWVERWLHKQYVFLRNIFHSHFNKALIFIKVDQIYVSYKQLCLWICWLLESNFSTEASPPLRRRMLKWKGKFP